MFGFEDFPTYRINWFSTTGKLILFGVVIVIGTILLLALPKKNAKAIKISKICLAIVLTVLELGRILWYYLRHLEYGDVFNVWLRINFHMCTMMVWTNVFLLFASCFFKKENKLMVALYNITFGVGILGAVMTFVYPEFIDPFFTIWNFRNSQTILTHIILIVSPLYLLWTKHYSIKAENLWYNALGLLLVGNISSLAGACSNYNFAYCFYCNFLTSIGINIEFPYHIWFMLCAILLIDFIFYMLVDIIKSLKKHERLRFKFTKFDMYGALITLVFIIIHPFIMQAILPHAPTSLGWLFLIPITIIILSIVTVNYIFKPKTRKIANKNLSKKEVHH